MMKLTRHFIAVHILLLLILNQYGFRLIECNLSEVSNSSRSSQLNNPTQLFRQVEIEKFKRKFLNLMGMTEIPNVGNESFGFDSLPAYVRNKVDEANQPSFARKNIEYSELLLKIKPINTCLQGVGTVCFAVDILERIPRQSIISARIVSERADDSVTGINIELWEIRIVNRKMTAFGPRLAVSGVGYNTTISLDFTNKLARWLRNEEIRPGTTQRNITRMFAIVCPHCAQFDAPSPVVLNRTILAINYKPRSERRRRQIAINDENDDVGEDYCNSQTSGCCRRKFTIRFAEIGWSNFIAQPDAVDINYCDGHCRNDTGSSSYNQLVRDYLNSINKSDGDDPILKICCVPSSYSSFTLTYVEAGGVMRQIAIPDFVVNGCNCI